MLRYFLWEYEGIYWSFLCVFLKFRLLWLMYEIIHTMKKTQKMGFTNVWLECDSALVRVVFTTRTNVPCMFCNRWNTCLNYYGKIRFRITHIFREENTCLYKLANLGFIHIKSFHWYNRISSSLFLKFFMNRYSLPIYHFC